MVNYDPNKILTFLPDILSALPLTIWIVVLTIILSSVVGGFLTWAQLAENNLLYKIARSYIFVMRCTPPIVLLFLVFYGIPEFLEWWLGIDVNGWSRAVFVVVAMVLLFSATISEIFKAAYLAIPKGQLEAGLTVGMTGFQTFRRILLPQLFSLALPNLTSAILNLLKDTALAYTIGLADIMGTANLIVGRNIGNYSLEAYTAVAIVYWGLALIISIFNQLLESRFTSQKG